ncbi:MAG: pilus assembly protein [Candidatus Methylomirabilis sp.]|nr:pilus assembly protein [Deltaproteobacteria bacterium]
MMHVARTVRRRLAGGREGQSVSEFLIVTPLLVLFILAIIYLGRLATTYLRLEHASAQWGIYAGRTTGAGDMPATVADTKSLFFSAIGGGPMAATTYNYSGASNTVERGVRDTFAAGGEVDMFYNFTEDAIWDRTGQPDGPDAAATRGAGLWGACDLQALFLHPLGMEQDLLFGTYFQETWKEGVKVGSTFDGGRNERDTAGGDRTDPSFKPWAAQYEPGSGYYARGGFTRSPAEFQPLLYDDGSQDGVGGAVYSTLFQDVEYYNDESPNAYYTPFGSASTEVAFSGRWNAAVDSWAYSATLAADIGTCGGGECEAFINDTGLGVNSNSSFWEPLISPLLAFDPACP